MATRQVFQIVVGNKDLSIVILIDQQLLGQVQACNLTGLHQGRTEFGVAEHQNAGGPQLHIHRSGIFPVIQLSL